MTTPYQPYAQGASSPRWLYRTVANVLRLDDALDTDGVMSMNWSVVPDIVDPYLDVPGRLLCRLDLMHVRPGKDQPPAIVAGRAPDRIGVLFYDPLTDDSGVPLVRAGDRIQCISGPVFGTFDIRVIPDVAQDYVGAHHVECQVVEVSQALTAPTPTPFPGAGA